MSDRRAIFIVVTILIDAIGFGIVMPVLPELIMTIGRIELSDAVLIGGQMSLVYAAAQFVGGPVMGNLGDRFGRRPVLLASMAGLALDYVLMALAHTLPLLFVGRLIAGLLGASFATAQAALADITPADQRAKRFGMVGAAFGIGFIIGPAIGGVLGGLDARTPFWVAAGLAALNFAYGWFVFPETLDPAHRRRFDWRRANPLGAWRLAGRVPGLRRLWLVLLLWHVATMVYPLIWNWYGIARFGWTTLTIGVSLAAVGVVMATMQGLVTGRVVARLGERRTAQIGMLGAATAFALYAVITQSWMAFAVMLPMAAQSLVMPSLSAMLSRRGGRDNQGEIQGVATMATGLGSVIAPLLYNPVMSHFTAPGPAFWPGAGFVIAVATALAALVVLALTPRRPAVQAMPPSTAS